MARRTIASEPVDHVGEVYIAVSDDGEGEVICQIAASRDEWLPLVAVDQKGLNDLRDHCQDLADTSGQTVRIICFTGRYLHETLRPSSTGDRTS